MRRWLALAWGDPVAALARRVAAEGGIDPSRLERRILGERLFGFRPYAVITLNP